MNSYQSSKRATFTDTHIPQHTSRTSNNPCAKTGQYRFKNSKELIPTLQGRIYLATDTLTNKPVIIKEAWRILVHNGVSRHGHKIGENFLRERQLLLDLSQKRNYPKSLIKCIDSWDDKHCYLYAMPFCQCELFAYISKHFNQSNTRKSSANIPMQSPNAWMQKLSHIFHQICSCIQWLHDNNYCHSDLSLENVMISDLQTLDIKVIDLGLAQRFKDNHCLFKGKIGKVQYMSPETYDGRVYNGVKNDIYCLGSMLYMMCIGRQPYSVPNEKDTVFKCVVNGYVKQVLEKWGKLSLITENGIDLVQSMMCYESQRIDSLDRVMSHSFFDCLDLESGKNRKY